MGYVTRAKYRLLLVVGALCLCLAAPAAADFDAGLSAFLDGDYRRAREIWLPLAEEGNAQSQFGLGMMIEGGHGVPPNPEKASLWYLRAADQGMAEAELSLGSLFEQGRGVARDPERAAELYRRAANKRNAQAQYNLAKLYLGGGITPNRDMGIAWLRKSAAQRYGRAVQHLAMMGEALEAPGSENSGDLLAGEAASAESVSDGPAPAPPRSDKAQSVTPQLEPKTDGEEHLNILAEGNQFEVPLDALVATLDDATLDIGGHEEDIEIDEKTVEENEGKFAVLLATFDRQEAAGEVWRKMRVRYPTLFEDLRANISPLILGGGATVLWRLEAGSLESEDAAIVLCKALRRQGEYCFPVRGGDAAE